VILTYVRCKPKALNRIVPQISRREINYGRSREYRLDLARTRRVISIYARRMAAVIIGEFYPHSITDRASCQDEETNSYSRKEKIATVKLLFVLCRPPFFEATVIRSYYSRCRFLADVKWGKILTSRTGDR